MVTNVRLEYFLPPDSYDGRDINKALGPWSESEIEQAIEDWNEDVMFEAMHGDGAED